jgi:mannose-6-phosphate isomerase-like protein (cupin superfamily)
MTEYKIHTDIKYDPLELVDVPALVNRCEDPWFHQTLCRVNDSVIRLGIVQGEFHWHKHDEEDEFFFVLSGKLFLDLEERTVTLEPNQGFTVPKGVRHRTRAPDRVVMLMAAKAGVRPTGDE